MIGDGSYMMANSELATSVMLGHKIIVVVLDNGGFGCINRLQQATGGDSFNNLFANARQVRPPEIDFAAHMAAMGARAEKVGSLAELQAAMIRARNAHDRAAPGPSLDPERALELEEAKRLPDRGARYAELLHHLSLGVELRSGS